MEVKSGYKLTEMGMLPEDWSIQQLGELKPFVTSGSRGWAAHYVERGDLFIRITNLTRESIYLDLKDCRFVRLQEGDSEGARTQVKENDVLISITADIGIIGYVDARVPTPAYVNQHIALLRFDPAKANGKFVGYFLASKESQKAFRSTTDTGAKAGMSLGGVQKIRAALPPTTDEQYAVATALSDMDALLEGLDRLIAKKRAIKQATMQQLLTGQTRLPGFSGEWEMKRLGDHLTFLKNGVNSRAELSSNEGIRYLHYGDIHGSARVLLNSINVEMPCLPRVKASRLDRLRSGDLVFADASEDLNGIGKSVEIQNVEDIEIVSGLHTIAVRFDKSVLADGFKAYMQFIPALRAHLCKLAAGTKVYATNRAHISSVELSLSSIAEQQAIVTLLSDMDAEITALETRRTKTRALKQAMMQELLTGRTRLVEPDAKPVENEAAQTAGRKANVHFLRSVLAAEIIDQLHDQPTFGHVKFEKMMFLVEHLCDVDTGSTYHRKAAGPYDNRALRSIDSQLQKQQWFEARKEGERFRYIPMAKRGGHRQYFDRHFSRIDETVKSILATFRTARTEQCEIVATLLAAWSDLLRQRGTVSDEVIVHEVLNNWHESKQRITEDRWLKALGWMRDKGFVPKGATSS